MFMYIEHKCSTHEAPTLHFIFFGTFFSLSPSPCDSVYVSVLHCWFRGHTRLGEKGNPEQAAEQAVNTTLTHYHVMKLI